MIWGRLVFYKLPVVQFTNFNWFAVNVPYNILIDVNYSFDNANKDLRKYL